MKLTDMWKALNQYMMLFSKMTVSLIYYLRHMVSGRQIFACLNMRPDNHPKTEKMSVFLELILHDLLSKFIFNIDFIIKCLITHDTCSADLKTNKLFAWCNLCNKSFIWLYGLSMNISHSIENYLWNIRVILTLWIALYSCIILSKSSEIS
jgi:hypothetical protein